ncbi:hypothetical protein OTU49_006804 [Cherax quadricarinatus]|uniref:Secreted protein n=1 Tax=Cherax quadricarinatus TaxID=27406 RepID=A0AAW0WK61_CHEQU
MQRGSRVYVINLMAVKMCVCVCVCVCVGIRVQSAQRATPPLYGITTWPDMTGVKKCISPLPPITPYITAHIMTDLYSSFLPETFNLWYKSKEIVKSLCYARYTRKRNK